MVCAGIPPFVARARPRPARRSEKPVSDERQQRLDHIGQYGDSPEQPIPGLLANVRMGISLRQGSDMQIGPVPQIGQVVRQHLRRVIDHMDLGSLIPAEVIEQGLDDLELGLGQLLADVERAARKGIPLDHAVHAHESYPYLGRFHGLIQDIYTAELPAELEPIVRRLVGRPPPEWVGGLMEQLCVVARAEGARPEERAFARLMVFEAIRVNLGFAAYQSRGAYEGAGGCRRDLDEIASDKLERLLHIPLQVDAGEPYRALLVSVVAAMSDLTQHIEQLRELRQFTRELANVTHTRALLEMELRGADPVDATILRNRFAADDGQQPIPMKRLPLEHPLLLAGYSGAALDQRSSRALKKLTTHGPSALRRACKPLTLAEMLLDAGHGHA